LTVKSSGPQQSTAREEAFLPIAVAAMVFTYFVSFGYIFIRNTNGPFIPLGIVLLGGIIAFRLRYSHHYPAAARTLLASLALAGMTSMALFGLDTPIPYFFPSLIFASALMLSQVEAFIAALLISILFTVAELTPAIFGPANNFPLFVHLAIVMITAGISWLASNGLTTHMEWYQQSYEMSRQRAEELRRNRDQLRKSLEYNEYLNSKLVAANAELEVAREAAEEANRLKTRFLANMSHELRTPLNAIISFSYILGAGMKGPVTDEQRDYLMRVYDSGNHLLGLINDILDLAKIEAGRLEIYPEPLDLGKVINSVLPTAHGLTKDKPIQLVAELEPDLPLVRADPTRIRQVLLNLLSNAAKFTNRGTITVRAQPRDDQVVVSVADSGIGLKPEHLPLVFEEYRQVDDSPSRRYSGTGLGLPISRQFIELHGGTMWVESEYGTGSTFYFALPVAPPPSSDGDQNPENIILSEPSLASHGS
jgi:signal transduction histidine kinase